jgi:hypothetical protein
MLARSIVQPWGSDKPNFRDMNISLFSRNVEEGLLPDEEQSCTTAIR